MIRASGILMPVFSLPSPYGIGTVGQAAFDFVDFLCECGQTYWQILPIGPTGYGDSPYQSFSAFAGNPYLIDLDLLIEQELLTRDEAAADFGDNPDAVDYGRLYKNRFDVLRHAARRLGDAPEFAAFCRAQDAWLDEYALYMAIKADCSMNAWYAWPEALRRREPDVLAAARARLSDDVRFWKAVQYLFFSQWQRLKTYANAHGVLIVGDLPIYVSPDSSDLWAHGELFQTDSEGMPTAVAGVPPDAFSADGQLWGNPLYDWKRHAADGYAWWIRRLRAAAGVYDAVRIDHFRGFAGYYAIPAGSETAAVGDWKPGPGLAFIETIRREVPELSIIAEDLGYLTPEVRRLLADSGFPGMKVLQFAFDSREESDYLPHNYTRNSVVYTGTHDNTTTRDWIESAPPDDVAFAREYLGVGEDADFTLAMVRAALSSVCDTAIIPMADWLRLGAQGRINTPSTLGGNWMWRMRAGEPGAGLRAAIRRLTKIYGRLPGTAGRPDPPAPSRASLGRAAVSAWRAGCGRPVVPPHP